MARTKSESSMAGYRQNRRASVAPCLVAKANVQVSSSLVTDFVTHRHIGGTTGLRNAQQIRTGADSAVLEGKQYRRAFQ